MMRMFGGVAFVSAFVAVATTLSLLILASGVLGIMASVTHIVLPLASDMSTDRERGRSIGTVMTGLLLGILLARTFSGWVSNLYGWRIVFVLAAAINLILFCYCALICRNSRRSSNSTMAGRYSRSTLYFAASHSFARAALSAGSRPRRLAASGQTLVFLLQSPYSLGAGAAGTFGIVGAAGAFIAPIAGRNADRHGSRYILTLGIAILATSYDIMWGGEAAHMLRLPPPGYPCCRRRGARPGRTDYARWKLDTHLRFGAIGAQSAQHGLHDNLLCRRCAGLMACIQGLGSLAVEWSLHARAVLRGTSGDEAPHWSQEPCQVELKNRQRLRQGSLISIETPSAVPFVSGYQSKTTPICRTIITAKR